MTRRIRQLGLTMVELMAALGLTLLVAGLGLLSMRGGLGAADSHSLAMMAAEQLRLARQAAMASQTPVAVVLPSNGGVTPASQSLYVATGTSMAHVSQVVTFSSDHRSALLFAGTWPLSSGSFTINPSLAGQKGSTFNVTQWLTNPNIGYDMNKDYAFVFQPDGSVVTNGLPYLNGAYYLLASAGATYLATSAPAGPTSPGPDTGLAYFAPTAMARPWAIAVTPSGEITLSAGLPRVGSGVSLVETIPVGGSLGAAPAVTTMPPMAVNVAVPGGVEIGPTATSTDGLPAGANTTLAPGQRVSLAVNLTETSGRDVYVSWTAQKGGSNKATTTPATGNFSCPAPEKMKWDATRQLWTSSWDWMCPVNAEQGDMWTFTPSFGGNVSAVVPFGAASQEIVAVKQPQIWAWLSGPGINWGAGPYTLYRANLDGTGQQAVITKQIAYASSTDEIFSSSSDGSVFVVATDVGYAAGTRTGGEVAQIPIPQIGGAATVKISPRGDKVVYARGSWPQSIEVRNIDGSSPTVLYTDGVGSPRSFGAPVTGADVINWVAWSPDQAKLAFVTNSSASGQGTVWSMNSDGTNRVMVANVTNSAFGYVPRADWDMTGRYLLVSRPDIDLEAHRWDSVTQTFDPGPFSSTSSNYHGSSTRQFTPDNTKIYFLDWAGQNVYCMDNSPLAPVTQVPFTVPVDPVLGTCRIMSFGITRN